MSDKRQADERTGGRASWHDATVWLTEYDVEAGWGPVEVELESGATVGDRNDWAWATIDPPVSMAGKERSSVLLGARHQGDTVRPTRGRWPMHVYVCAPKDGVTIRDTLRAEDVTIGAWGLLHESRDRAQADKF